MKTKESQSVAPTEVGNATALVTTGSTAVAVYDPGLAADDVAGMEQVDSRDLRLPFLAIAQKTSKVIDKTEGKYIEGLEFGEMYNSESREILGTGPIEFVPVRLQKRARLLDPQTNLLGETVDWDDPRVIPPWEPGSKYKTIDDVEGVRIYDWAVLLLPSFDQMILSLKSTSFTAGKSLITILDKFRKLSKMANKGFRPYQVRLGLSTYIDKNPQGSFGKFKIELAGPMAPGQFSNVDETTYRFADAWFEQIKDKNLVAEEEESTGGDTPETVEGEVVQGQPVTKENVPF